MPNSPKKTVSISREWQQYLVKAVVGETSANWPNRSDSEILNHSQKLNRDYDCRLFALPVPIALLNDVRQVLTMDVGGKTFRLYPPFPLNEERDASAAFAEIVIPEGTAEVDGTTPIPSDAVTGLRVEHNLLPNAIWARGLRVDVQFGGNVQAVIGSFLDHVCQYTQQWWVRGGHSPFLDLQRFGAEVDLNFRTRRLFGYKGAGRIESPWYGTIRYQPALGAAALLDKRTWIQISKHIAQGESADIGVLGIHDAVADYMAGRDDKCILNLCISVEILLNKHWQGILKKPGNDKLDKIIRKSPLLDGETRETLFKLMIDRGHVAHGRAPHIIATDPNYTIERYISAAKVVLQKYLSSIPHGAWPQLMTMRINRSG
jgi:hypothetical protein